MRILSFITAAAFVATMPLAAYADCVNNPTSNGALSATQLTSLLGGKIACVAGGFGWENQEYHSGTATGSIIDYKHGAPGAGVVDQTLTIGTYAVTGTTNGQVTYSYTGGGTYTYYVLGNSAPTTPRAGTYFFCTTFGGSAITVKVEAGSGPCV